ncbi:hypothetical protein [Tabrizicola sp.]|uniref:hypothetical protein n=1 Tax=Tabrizicola sp. TaxID=2005166 RepID=UPI0035B1BFA8
MNHTQSPSAEQVRAAAYARHRHGTPPPDVTTIRTRSGRTITVDRSRFERVKAAVEKLTGKPFPTPYFNDDGHGRRYPCINLDVPGGRPGGSNIYLHRLLFAEEAQRATMRFASKDRLNLTESNFLVTAGRGGRREARLLVAAEAF